MKTLADGTQVHENLYYHVLEYFDDDRTSIEDITGKNRVVDLNKDQFLKAISHISQDWNQPLHKIPMLKISENDQTALLHALDHSLNCFADPQPTQQLQELMIELRDRISKAYEE